MGRDFFDALRRAATPRHVHGEWGASVCGDTVEFGGVRARSRDLAGFLAGAARVAVVGVTLGASADACLNRLMRTDMAQAVIADRFFSGLAEEYMGDIQARLGGGKRRYSPGYGDFSLEHQRQLLDMLGCWRIGLFMTDGFMLAPSKSITAVFPAAGEFFEE